MIVKSKFVKCTACLRRFTINFLNDQKQKSISCPNCGKVNTYILKIK